MEKQIEEMERIVGSCESIPDEICVKHKSCARCKAERVFNADYRKQSEVASEIFWEIDKLLTAIYLDDEDGTNFVGVDIQKYHALKKKYMEK